MRETDASRNAERLLMPLTQKAYSTLERGLAALRTAHDSGKRGGGSQSLLTAMARLMDRLAEIQALLNVSRPDAREVDRVAVDATTDIDAVTQFVGKMRGSE